MTNFRRLLRLLPLALMLGAVPAHAETGPTVTIVQISGGIDSAYAGFLRGEIARANRDHDVAVVLRLSSSLSVKVDTAALARVVRDSRVPVATWVGPKGRRATGTAARLWEAGDVRLLATGASVASTVAPDGSAGTLVEAVRTLDGRVVDGATLHVDPAVIDIRFARPGPVVAVRHALATNPTLVYLLLLCGIGAIVFEAFQPGFGPAGYAGGILVALAAYGLVALPIVPLGLAMVLLGVGGMAWDVRRDSLSLPTWLGAVLLAAGSWSLVHSAALRPALWAIVVGVLGSLTFYGIVMTVVLRALRGQTRDLGRALVGRSGEVRSTLNPQGHVLVEGALWRARALEWDGPVAAGTPVRVTGVDEQALVLDVEPIGKGST